MSDTERLLLRLRRRWLVGEFLHVAAGWLAGFLVAFGLAVLAVKLFAPRLSPNVYWTALAAVPLLGFVGRRAVRRTPSEREAVALLDLRLDAGGLLMTLTERPDPRWRERLPSAETWAAALPRVRPVRFAKAVAVPALFAAGAGFVPAREEPPPPPKVTAGTEAAKQLEETFELLDKSDALDEQTRESVKKELEQLAREAEERPLTHEKWETVDALRERLQTGLDATDLTVSKGQSAAAALAAALANGEPLSAEQADRLGEELREALETLRKNGAFDDRTGSEVSASSELRKLLKSDEFKLPSDASARKEALDQLRQMLDAEQKKLADARGKCQSCLGGRCLPGDQFGRGDGSAASRSPGQGGISRGPGDADPTYGAESDEQAAKFKETVLPPGYLDKPKQNVIGVTASAPQIGPTAPEARNGARDSAVATGNATWDRPLRPRHRDVVRGYFGEK